MNLTFYLHTKTDKAGRRYIYARYTHASKVWRLGTGYKIDPKFWNAKKGNPKNNFPQAEFLKAGLSRIEGEILGTAYQLKADNIDPTPSRVKEQYNGERESVSLPEAWREYVKEKVHGRARNTQLSYLSVEEEILTGGRLRAMGKDWLEGIIEKYEEAGHGKPTIKVRLSHIRRFLLFCLGKGWIKDEGFKVVKIRGKTQIIKTYLNLEEIDKLRRLHISQQSHEEARDRFLFHCATGLRFGDGTRLRMEMVKGDVLELITEKTKKRAVIPLTPEALEILKKYNGLPKPHIRDFNMRLKAICKKAGIDSEVNEKGVLKQKWEVVTSHTARRSFITNLLNSGVSPSLVSKMVQHSDLNQTHHYDQSGEAEMREAVRRLT